MGYLSKLVLFLHVNNKHLLIINVVIRKNRKEIWEGITLKLNIPTGYENISFYTIYMREHHLQSKFLTQIRNKIITIMGKTTKRIIQIGPIVIKERKLDT